MHTAPTTRSNARDTIVLAGDTFGPAGFGLGFGADTATTLSNMQGGQERQDGWDDTGLAQHFHVTTLRR